jgi:hypothetical protein
MEDQSFKMIEQTELLRAHDALKAGLENTRELLYHYEATLERGVVKSLTLTAERLEREAQEMEAAIEITKWPYDVD